MNLIIRKATLNDLTAILELNHKLFEFEYNNDYDRNLNMNWTYSDVGTKHFENLIISGTVWIAIDEDKIIGYLAGCLREKLSFLTKPFAEIENLYIDEGYRGQSIGEKLIQKFKKYCIEHNYDEIKVCAYSQNTKAIKFYKNNGFEEFETICKIKL